MSLCRVPDRSVGRGRSGGFTLLELMFAVAAMAVLTAVAVPAYRSYLERSRTAATIADIAGIHLAIQRYVTANYQPPPDLATVGQAGILDPWGRPYAYLSFAGLKGKGPMRKDKNLVPINSQYDLYSMGPDGKSVAPLTAKASRDDIILANDGAYIGPASDY
jgi:general secretion pathway protein G